MSPDRWLRLPRRRARLTAVLAGIVVAGLVLAHLAGLVGLDQALRAGTGAVGLLCLAFVLHVLALSDGEDVEAGAPGRGAAARLRRVRRRLASLLSRRTRSAGSRPVGQTEGMEELVRLSASSAMDFHVRLRPRLSAAALFRLENAGIDPADRAAVAAALGPLGPVVADPNPRPPADRSAPGPSPREMAALLRRLEQLR